MKLSLAYLVYFGFVGLSCYLVQHFNTGIIGGFLVGCCFGTIGTYAGWAVLKHK